MNQPTLPFELDRDRIKAFLEKASGKDLALVITDNSTNMLSIREVKGTVRIRLHRMFLSAGSDVLHEIADYIRHYRKKTPLVREFINQNANSLKKPAPRKIRVRTKGKHHDLQKIFNSINTEYFSGRISASITWGFQSPGRTAAKRTLGSYSYHSNTIRINPSMDSRAVPRYYMDFLVYHEMLHADIGIIKKNGRRIIHSGEFKKREKEFRGYKRALEWEKKRW